MSVFLVVVAFRVFVPFFLFSSSGPEKNGLGIMFRTRKPNQEI